MGLYQSAVDRSAEAIARHVVDKELRALLRDPNAVESLRAEALTLLM